MNWIIYCLIEGTLHARFYHNNHQKNFNFDTHIIWTAMRLIVIGLILWQNWESIDSSSQMGVYFFDSKQFFIMISYPLMQPFIHNGMYYTMRYFMSGRKIYKKLWFDQSTTSTAKLTKILTPGFRTGWFIIGLLIYLILL